MWDSHSHDTGSNPVRGTSRSHQVPWPLLSMKAKVKLMAKEDIHNYRKTLERIKRNYIHNSFFKEDVKDLERFLEILQAEGISAGRIAKCLHALSTLSKKLGKPFSEVTERDVKSVLAEIEGSEYSDWTKRDFRIILRKYLRFIGKEEIANKIKLRNVKSNKQPQEILTEEDIKAMAEVAYTTRDRAFVLTLYESGCRIGEFLPIKLGQVSFDQYGAVLLVRGKTGDRRVRLVASSLALQRWIEEHPNKRDPNAYLWCKIPSPNNPKWRNRHLSYGFVCRLLRELAEKAGVKKSVNPHAFRHARATFLANYLTEAQLKEFFGWDNDSKMAAVYVHLSGRDVDNAVLGVYGFRQEKSKEPLIKMQICKRCNEQNEPGAKFCRRCGMPLDGRTYQEAYYTDKLEETMILFLRVIGEILPEAKTKFKEIAKEKGILDIFS